MFFLIWSIIIKPSPYHSVTRSLSSQELTHPCNSSLSLCLVKSLLLEETRSDQDYCSLMNTINIMLSSCVSATKSSWAPQIFNMLPCPHMNLALQPFQDKSNLCPLEATIFYYNAKTPGQTSQPAIICMQSSPFLKPSEGELLCFLCTVADCFYADHMPQGQSRHRVMMLGFMLDNTEWINNEPGQSWTTWLFIFSKISLQCLENHLLKDNYPLQLNRTSFNWQNAREFFMRARTVCVCWGNVVTEEWLVFL